MCLLHLIFVSQSKGTNSCSTITASCFQKEISHLFSRKRFDETPGTSRCFWVEKSLNPPRKTNMEPHKKGFPKGISSSKGHFLDAILVFGRVVFLRLSTWGIWLIFVSEVFTLNDKRCCEEWDGDGSRCKPFTKGNKYPGIFIYTQVQKNCYQENDDMILHATPILVIHNRKKSCSQRWWLPDNKNRCPWGAIRELVGR